MKKDNEKGDESMASNYIRFDWAMKRLLRNKANFAVLEGFLTTLLNEKIVIQTLLESESNQDEYVESDLQSTSMSAGRYSGVRGR